MGKTGDLTPGACRDCAHALVSVYAEPCKTCHLSSVHKAWRPKESEETNTYMEGKGCENCRWRYAPSNTPPCSKCDGFELDKWELHEWGEDHPDLGLKVKVICDGCELDKWEFPGDDPEPFVDQVLADMDVQGTIQEIVKRQREALAEIVGSNIADSLMPEGGSPGPVGDFKKELEALMEKSGKPVYQQRIEERIEAQVAKGRAKYGVTLEDNVTLTEAQRIEHLEEELIDALMYCEHLAAAGRERGLTADDYQRAALRTAQVTTMTDEDLILNGVMGLSGEAGECIDLVKKVRFQGHALDRDKFLLELGDVAWYLAVAAHGAGFRLSEVFEANIDKLKKRYPDGFDKARSMNRAGEVTGTEA